MKIRLETQNKFIDDWIKIAAKYAQQALGLAASNGAATDGDILLANNMERVPKKIPREIKLSDVFTCPSNLQTEWSNLRQKIEQGDDLYPHLSRQIKKLDCRDPMLMHWRINHFHIGVEPDPKHLGLIRGGGHIVYAHFDDEYFYAIALLPHGHWEDVQLIETIKRNWPNNEHFVRDMVLDTDYGLEGTLQLRKNQINAPTRLGDGSHFMAYGETLAGTSTLATLKAMGIRRVFGYIQSELQKDFSKYFPDIPAKEGDLINAEVILDEDRHFSICLHDHEVALKLNIGSIDELIEGLKS